MIYLELLIIIISIWLGTRGGGITLGFSSGCAMLILSILGENPGKPNFDIAAIILAVVTVISTLETAGGTVYLVQVAKLLLRKKPQRITIFAPLVAYTMCLIIGTSYMVIYILPIIIQVAKANGIPPVRPIAITVVVSKLALVASPFSPALLILARELAPFGISYSQLLMVLIPATLTATLTAALLLHFWGMRLPKQQKTLTEVHLATYQEGLDVTLPPYARRSLLIFIFGVLAMTGYTLAMNNPFVPVQSPLLASKEATIIFMLSTAYLIVWSCRIEPSRILETVTFRTGTSACLCVMGMAWLGGTFFGNHLPEIKGIAGGALYSNPWLLALVLFCASSVFNSISTTTSTIIPIALAMGVPYTTVVSSFPAVCAIFILPNYPTLLAAVSLDDTGSTRIGKFLLDHPFLIPCLATTLLSIAFSLAMCQLVI